MNIHEGAALREAMVERTVDRMALRSVRPGGRFYTFGGVRMGVLVAAHELAKVYPQLAERIYERFGMSGWTDNKKQDKSVEKLGSEKI